MRGAPLILGAVFDTPRRTVGEGDIGLFAGLIGDFTPLHVDDVFARSTEFQGRIAHGALVMSMATGLLTQTGILGERVIALLGINWQFKNAVKIGDTIQARVSITELRPTRKTGRNVATFGIEVVNQHGSIVQSGTMVVLVREDAGSAETG